MRSTLLGATTVTAMLMNATAALTAGPAAWTATGAAVGIAWAVTASLVEVENVTVATRLSTWTIHLRPSICDGVVVVAAAAVWITLYNVRHPGTEGFHLYSHVALPTTLLPPSMCGLRVQVCCLV